MPPESTGHVIDGDLWDSYYPAGRDKGAPSGAQNKRDNDSIRDNARLSLRPEPKVIHSSAPAPDDATSTAKMLAPQRFSAGMRRLFRPSEKVATRPADRVTTSTLNLLLLLEYVAASGGMQVLRQCPKEEPINLHVTGSGQKMVAVDGIDITGGSLPHSYATRRRSPVK